MVLDQGIEEGRWPTKLIYGRMGELKHSYSRIAKPNVKKKSARYRCKSYCTYQCSAKLKIVEVGGHDEYILTGEHTNVCKANNGILPVNEEQSDNHTEAKIVDIGTQFKKACADLALDKIWLQPMKIWELVRDEMVPKCPHGVVVPSSEQVSMDYLHMLT